MSGAIDKHTSAPLILVAMNLQTYLAKKEISQSDFAVSVGVTQGRIAQLVAGDQPSLKLAQRIAEETKGAVPLAVWGNSQKAA